MQMTSSQAPHKRYMYLLLPLPLLTVDSHKMLHKISAVCPLLHVVALSSEYAFHAPASVQQRNKNKNQNGRERREIVIVSA